MFYDAFCKFYEDTIDQMSSNEGENTDGVSCFSKNEETCGLGRVVHSSSTSETVEESMESDYVQPNGLDDTSHRSTKLLSKDDALSGNDDKKVTFHMN